MELNPIGAPPEQIASAVASGQFANNFETFLTLLTKQLEMQDPLEPMKSDAFVTQLVQFTSVEQAIASNKHLERLVEQFESNGLTGAVGFLGMTVEIEGETAMLSAGKAEWRYALAGEAASTTITIFNEGGAVVHSAQGGTAAGDHTFVWDGFSDDNVIQPGGPYRIEISARNANGAPVGVSTTASGRVSGIETADHRQMLVVGGKLVPLSDVIAVREGPRDDL